MDARIFLVRISISESRSFSKNENPVITRLFKLPISLIALSIIIINLIQICHSDQYVSSRICQKISANVNQSIYATTQQARQQQVAIISNVSMVDYSETHHLTNLSLQDGAKYAFWIQCTTGGESRNETNGAIAARVNQVQASELDMSRGESGSLSSDYFENLGSILDWTLGREESDDELEERLNVGDETASRGRRHLVKDDRYDYLLSVSARCKRKLSKLCTNFKLGLLDGRSSVELSKCPDCGLHDQNCENVHHCTSECGQLKSINYPQNYGNNHRCRWSIRAPDGYYVNLSVIDFDIPSSQNASKLGTCIFDYLTLIDGYTGKRLGCYCNEHLPPANIVSPWNELIIQFDTNSETTGRGFYFSYQFKRLELDERIRAGLISALPWASSAANAAISEGKQPAGTSAQQVPPQVCLHGWQYFRGSCYKAYNGAEPLQWYDAESSCSTFGEGLDGHLVSILDRDEMLIILYWLTNVWNSTRYREYYIGLIDVSREGLYRWSDNNPMSYTDWELKPMLLEDETPAQPDGGAYEDCTVIRYSSISRTSNWHDVPCSLGKHYHNSHLDKSRQINFKWDYVSSFICKSDSISLEPASSPHHALRSRVRRPLFSNEFKPAPNLDHLISHLSATSSAGGGQQGGGGGGGVETAADKTEKSPGADSGQPGQEVFQRAQQVAKSGSPQQAGFAPVQMAPTGHSAPLSPGQLASAQAAANSSRRSSQHARLAKLDDNRYFVCDNLEVISTVLRCDGIAHCRDGSDESNGCDQECLDWQFRCANGRCISIGYYCDFSDDCGDGSDESRCERHRCKLNEFRCQSGQCIAAHQRCDLLPDCRDSSDEGTSCTVGSNCNSASTFQCYNGLCIPQYAVCDFQIDCPGKFHEDEDASTCELLQKLAQINSTDSNSTLVSSLLASPVSHLYSSLSNLNASGQMPASQLLLLASNSSSSSSKQQQLQQVRAAKHQPVVFYPAHEAAAGDPLPGNLFRCKSGNSIDIGQRCLFEFDKYGYQLGCRDVSHLVDCDSFECPQRDYVKCSNSYCIPWRYVCDGKWDCIMGDDEVGCARYVCPGQYKCANQSSCILLHQLCDSHRQCPMGDDEWFCDLQCPPGCDCIGLSVSCRGANLSQLLGASSNFISRSVRKLDLSYNNLGPRLAQTNFDAYHELGELILSHNKIEVLPPRKFHQLRNLYKLDLSYNQIHSVKRGAFAGLRRVTQLLLESNQQLFLLEPEAFLGLSSLQILNISSSRIQSLRKNTFDGLTSLRHLQLRSNMIVSVEDGAFRSLTSLVSLDMRGNDIKHFTKSVFGELKSLRNLSTDSFKFCCLVNHQIPADRCLPLPDEISDCEDLLSSVPQRSCIWIAGGIACLGNLIVIIWRYRDRLGQKERELEQINSTLLLSLACSDLLMGIYLIIIALVDSWYRGRYIESADKWRESPLCNLCGFLATVSSTVSVLTLVFIAQNRFSEICRPLDSPSKFTLGATHRLIQASWLLALTIATLPLLIWPYFQGQFYARSGVCLAFHITDQRAAGWLYSIIVSPCFNLIAFLFIFRCYCGIYLEISRAKLKILLILLVHLVAFSPPIIIGFISLAGYTPPAALYSWIAVLVLPVNSAINPMIYTIPNIRHTIKLLIQNYRARKSGNALLASRQRSIDSSLAANGRSTSIDSQAQQQQQQQQPLPLMQLQAKELLGGHAMLKRKLSKRNIPPGYKPLAQFISTSPELTADQLVHIALQIARDLEQKHAESKVYVSLSLNNVFVSDQIAPRETQPANSPDRKQLATKPEQIAIYLADSDGYRPRRAPGCCHLAGGQDGSEQSPAQRLLAASAQPAPDHLACVRNHQHHHHHHKPPPDCDCYDVLRFGDILLKLIQIYSNRRKQK